MSEEEINKTIAEYMSWYKLFRHDRGDIGHGLGYVYNNNEGFETVLNFTKSLDALVPVVEKLKLNACLEFDNWHRQDKSHWSWDCDIYIKDKNKTATSTGYGLHDSESPSLALAIACAKVIKELGE